MGSSKLELELKAVRVFQMAGGLPVDMILREGSNPPDVIACGATRMIGIEVRRLYADEGADGSRQRRQHAMRDAVVARAARLHRQRVQGWYAASVAFSGHVILSNDRVAQIAESLVAFATSEELVPGQIREFRAEVHWGRAWPPEVGHLMVARFEGGEEVHWSQLGGGWEGRTTRQLLQYGLDEKEHVVNRLPPGLGERWLLLYCDGTVESSLLALHDQLHEDRFRSSFDRAFVMDHTGRRYSELVLESS